MLGAHFSNSKYSYAHLDGRGVEYFKGAFDSKQEWCLGLGSLKETTLGQYINGVKIYQQVGAKIIPIVENMFMIAVFSEVTMGEMVDTEGNVIQEAPTPEPLAEGEYALNPDDFPKGIDMPYVELVEHDLPMTLPGSKSVSSAVIEPFLINISKSGECLINKEGRGSSMEELAEALNNFSNLCRSMDAIPVVMLNVAHGCEQKKVVDVLDVLKDVGINSVTFTNDKKVEKDDQNAKDDKSPNVLGAVVVPEVDYLYVNDGVVEMKRGRIVVNVRSDGTYTKASIKEVMKTSQEIQAYIKAEREKIETLYGKVKVNIHLRGGRESIFKYSQTVISAAAEAGVNEIVFSVYPFDEKK